MTLTRSQFAAAALADEKWVENTARLLGQRLTYTSDEARRMGLVRLLTRELGVPVARAAEVAAVALDSAPGSRALAIPAGPDSAATVVIDLARFYSTFAAALSAALNHGGPRRRGRSPKRKRMQVREAMTAAESYGVDVSLLRESLERTPAERLARLDANAAFLNALRPASQRTRRPRGRRRG